MRTEDSGLSCGITRSLNRCAQAAEDLGDLIGLIDDPLKILLADVPAVQGDVELRPDFGTGTLGDDQKFMEFWS